MKYTIPFWFILSLMLSSINLQAQDCSSVSVSDSLKLVSFYEAMDGDNWINNEGWLSSPVKDWYGITVSYVPDSSQCYVSEISLVSNRLDGIIPELNLDKLTVIDLFLNRIKGTIPDFNLPSLLTLKLDSNIIQGIVPNFSNIPLLRHLHLRGNQLTGNIPDFSLIKDLNTLDFHNNHLTGTVPDFSNLTNLKTLVLGKNQLSGNVTNFSKLPNLEGLDLGGNELTGPIPHFENITKIDFINLQFNQLTGTIPNFDLPLLRILALGGNQLTGVIPNFDKTPILNTLLVHKNQLTGYIPNFKHTPLLEFLWVCPGNSLSAIVPDFSNFLLFNYESSQFDCMAFSTFTGIAFNDKNNNCLQDEGETTIPNTKITVNDSLLHTYTDENGFYKLQLDTGTYSIKATPPNFLWQQKCPENYNYYTITIENYNDSIPSQNFGFEAESECTFLTIDIATPLQRRCFTNTYTVSYCNEGTKSADSAYVELTFPPDIIPLNTSIPFEENGNVWSFDLGTLMIGECGSFTVTDLVSCNAVLGSTACVEARIYPAFLCREVSSLWDGSDLVVEGECVDNEFIEFTITNIGEDMQDSIEYRIYEDDILSALDKVQLMEGESQELSISATGATYRLKAEQTDFHPLESIPQAIIELCGEEPYSLGFVTSQANSDFEHFIDIDCQEIIGSFDPNDKSVHPTGITNQHYIAEGTELTYKVRFQNTGNDTAFRVSIIDTLQSEYLDLQTFKITNTSHPYEAHINDQNVLIVEFDNILLPDSTTNEPESHGFVQYKITSFQDAPQNSIVTNLANIYFDYNQPITTNTVFNTIGIPQLESNQNMALLQFDAYLDEQKNIQLTWITASEIANSYFEVQRSSNGIYFEKIGGIAAQSPLDSPNFYVYEDNELEDNIPIYYYRLKQMDFNGQFIYSNITDVILGEVVAIDPQNQLVTKIWYNAAQNNVEVVTNQSHQLQIFDINGRLVKNVNITEGRQTIGTKGLASGIYAYQLLQNGLLRSGQTGKLIIVGN
ncbi:MAG: SdrD B-like domain-containing protein [Chitinophagales bacterium]